MKLLLQNEATNVNAVDKSGHTALDAVTTAIEGELISSLVYLSLSQTKVSTFGHCSLIE